MDLLMQAIERAGRRPGDEIAIALDPAATELFVSGQYVLEREGRTVTGAELADLWADWAKSYPTVSIADGMDATDWEGWQAVPAATGVTMQLAGARRGGGAGKSGA